jgi:hypothetical protein
VFWQAAKSPGEKNRTKAGKAAVTVHRAFFVHQMKSWRIGRIISLFSVYPVFDRAAMEEITRLI